MNKSENIKNLAGALAKAQAKMPVIKMDKTNKFLGYSYATLGALINACRPVLAENELSVIQFPINDGDKLGVSTTVLHSSGEWIESLVFVSPDEKKGLSVAQEAGVAFTYLRRYAYAAALSVYADEDTDASKNGEEDENRERPAKVLPAKPKPEPKIPAPATDMQKLRVAFGQKFTEALSKGIKIEPISGKATAEEIQAAIKAIDDKIAAVQPAN